MVYFITYDLNKAGKNYEGVYQAIKDASTGAWCHFWESSWLIRSNLITADIVFDRIRPYLDNDDRCLVVEVKATGRAGLNKTSGITSIRTFLLRLGVFSF